MNSTVFRAIWLLFVLGLMLISSCSRDLADAKTLKVSKTPGFFANGRPLESFGYQQLQTLIESELKIQYP